MGGIVSAHGPTKMCWKIAYIAGFIALGAVAFYFLRASNREIMLTQQQRDSRIARIEGNTLELLGDKRSSTPPAPFATADELLTNHFKGRSVKLADLVGKLEITIIRSKTFEDCDIHGPAVIYLMNYTKLVDNSFRGALDTTFIVTTQKVVTGVIGLEDCVFRKCNFHNISIIGSPEAIETFKKGFTVVN